MTYPNKEQYEANERRHFINQVQEVESTPIDKDAVAKFKLAIGDELHSVDYAGEPRCLISERVEWLIAGNYGKGSYDATMQVIKSPRMNRASWLIQTIGALEWNVKSAQIRKAWHQLTDDQKFALERVLKQIIIEAEFQIKEYETA